MENLQEYRWGIETQDPYLCFFCKNPLKHWDFQAFAAAFREGKTLPPRQKTLEAAYQACLSNIFNSTATPVSVKNYVRYLQQPQSDEELYEYNVFNIGIMGNVEADTVEIVNNSNLQQENRKRRRLSLEEITDSKTYTGEHVLTKGKSKQSSSVGLTDTAADDTIETYQDVTEENTSEDFTIISSPPFSVWTIDDDDDLWLVWLKLLRADIPHQLSLENMHIIQCGFSIKCDPRIPKELYKNICLQEKISNVCHSSPQYIRNYLEASRTGDLDKMIMASVQIELLKDPETRPFLMAIFLQFAEHIFPDESAICRSEATYNHRLIWPCLEAFLKKEKCLKFWPGEVALNSMPSKNEENKHAYNADGIIRLDDDIEILLLETSGPFNNSDKPRHAFDHVKGAFGLRCMLRKIISKFHYGDIDILKKLQVFFVHARGQCIHVWKMEIPVEEVLVMERVLKIEVPRSPAESFKLLKLADAFWALKNLMDTSLDVIRELENSHAEYLIEQMLGENSENNMRRDLRELLNNEIEKPIRQPGVGDLLPRSSPDIEPNSPSLFIENI
ncbi:hypothetical protein DFQ28_009970 [Apophysomyces sp. BC1034]|nr:hypothetical protein DFQ29_008468 [Apophysomyces sp. BC1021]KAG0185084.1 hypothetical protein DFQ28_009970 [Apophysomyces sp. BC1034]